MPRTLAMVTALLVAVAGCSLSANEGAMSTTLKSAETGRQPPGFVAPDPEEARIAVERCLADRGFVAVDNGTGGILIESTPAQQGELRVAMKECSRSSLGLGPGEEVPPPTEDQVRAYYEALLASAECLRGIGYGVSEPPTFDAYLDEGVASWDPFGEVLNQNQLAPAEFQQVTDDCPVPRLYS